MSWFHNIVPILTKCRGMSTSPEQSGPLGTAGRKQHGLVEALL